ncbi:hypothetical protein KC358_g38 [Hortaea werneckii]|nr:hypothetical protein KC358_g38 [Hortaea werneckii]
MGHFETRCNDYIAEADLSSLQRLQGHVGLSRIAEDSLKRATEICAVAAEEKLALIVFRVPCFVFDDSGEVAAVAGSVSNTARSSTTPPRPTLIIRAVGSITASSGPAIMPRVLASSGADTITIVPCLIASAKATRPSRACCASFRSAMTTCMPSALPIRSMALPAK